MTKYFCHETAVIDEGAQIGSGTKIWHFVHISSGAVIGNNVTLGHALMEMRSPSERVVNCRTKFRFLTKSLWNHMYSVVPASSSQMSIIRGPKSIENQNICPL